MSTWNALSRKQQREENKIPEWVPIGDDDPNFKRLWMQDDAHPPDAENGTQAWERIFGTHYSHHDIKETWDGGDSMAELHRGNRIYENCCGLVTIWQYLPPRKFD